MNRAKFHTEVEIPSYNWQTGYTKKNMFIGSCFTENVGNKMAELAYEVDINPFGILYNPVSVGNALQILLDKKMFTESDLIESDGLWHSFYHHGRFSSTNPGEAIRKINERIKTSADFLASTNFLFLTFGTAWVYNYKKSGQAVSNCHKISAKEFQKTRLSVKEIIEYLNPILEDIYRMWPEIKIVFTVSPIRHFSDGAIENQRSKAALILAIDELIRINNNKNLAYFPAYEIVMDELRDYRYYAEDMIHLTDVAVAHIWDRFSEKLIDRKSREISKRINKILLAKRHRPIHQNTVEFKNFIESIINHIDKLTVEFPHINLMLEKEFFVAELNKIKKEIGKN
jgi:hypothetical protein